MTTDQNLDLHHKNGQAHIMLNRDVDISTRLGRTERTQNMAGFDDRFTDIVDYIIRITHEIWDEKGIGVIYETYAHNCEIHTSSGTIYGRESVVQGTIQALAGFPDRHLSGDEVIWGGDDQAGFYTSHRITHEGHNYGHTPYGAPTHKKVQYKAIADCVSRQNRIYEEWLVRDEISLIRQLGFKPVELAKRMANLANPSADDFNANIASDIERLRGQLPPKPIQPAAPDDIETFIRNSYHEIWNWRMLNKVDDYFASNLVAESASDRSMHGIGSYHNYILQLLSPLPDLMLTVDNFCMVGDAETGYRTATRWILQGTHTGIGIYGKPTGKPVQVIGISHHLIEHGKITREWTVFDEFAILKQIHA